MDNNCVKSLPEINIQLPSPPISNDNNLNNNRNNNNHPLQTLNVQDLNRSGLFVDSTNKNLNDDHQDDEKKKPLPPSTQQHPSTLVPNIPIPPDGGFGWAVVFASFMCNVIVDGIIFSFGILLPKISQEFDENKSTTAWIGSLQAGFYLIVGPLVSALAQRYDRRTITIIGSVLAALGFILSYFAKNIITLYFTYGILGGIGFGFIFLPAIVTVGYYFESRRAFATGIAVCGSGIGTFVMPPIIQYLIEHFGWRINVLVLATITLFCAIFGSFFRPLKFDDRQQQQQQQSNKFGNNGNGNDDYYEDDGYGDSIDSPIKQKPLLMRIKEARLAEWAKSEEDLNDYCLDVNGVNCYVGGGGGGMGGIGEEISPTSSQNSAPPPYHDVLPRRPSSPPLPLLLSSQKRLQQISVSKASLNVGSIGALSSRRRTKSTVESIPETNNNNNNNGNGNGNPTPNNITGSRMNIPNPRKITSPRDEMLYSNLSLVVLPQPSRSYANLYRSQSKFFSQTTIGPNDELETEQELGGVQKFLSGFDLSLLKRPSFVLLSLNGFLCLVGFFIPFIYLSDRAKLLGCSPDKCAFILSIIGMTNTIGRVLCGWASDSRVNALLLNNIALTVGGLATIISPMVFNTYPLLIFYGSVVGISLASFATLRSVITVELLGLERLTSAFGLLLLFQGLAVTIGSPIAGWFFDMTGSYDYSFYLSGITITLSGVMCYPLNAIAKWEKKYFNEDNDYDDQDHDDDYFNDNNDNGVVVVEDGNGNGGTPGVNNSQSKNNNNNNKDVQQNDNNNTEQV